MKFEIENKSEFSEMIKQSWNDILDWLPRYKSNSLRVALKAFTKNWFDDIDETIKELDVKYYENVIFKYFWWIVKNVVKHEKWKLKVQDFYDSISNIYPNKDSGIVASHLASSWESNKDIKNMKYPFA